MGTHPIFESDFDCLTECLMLRKKYNIPDCPVEEMNPLEQRWYKIKSYGSFPVNVKYYGECGLPLEYVQFLPEALRKQAMEEAANDDGVEDAIKGLELEDGKDGKKQKRGGRATVKAKKKQEPGDIKIGRLSRGKKKSVTRITGLMTYSIDLKKTAKLFGNKFACGSSSNEKADEIVIQGDFIDQVIDILEDKFPQIPSNKIFDLGDIK